MQRIEPSLCMSRTFFVGPLQPGAVQHLTMILQPTRSKCANMLAQLFSRQPSLRVGRHGLSYLIHDFDPQQLIHIMQFL